MGNGEMGKERSSNVKKAAAKKGTSEMNGTGRQSIRDLTSGKSDNGNGK